MNSLLHTEMAECEIPAGSISCFSSRCTFFISFHVSHFVTYPCLLSQVHLLAALLCDYLPHPNVFHLCLIVSPVYLNCILPRLCATSITFTVAQHSSCDSLCMFLTQFSPLVFALPAPLFVLHARLDWLLLCRTTVKTLNFYLLSDTLKLIAQYMEDVLVL